MEDSTSPKSKMNLGTGHLTKSPVFLSKGTRSYPPPSPMFPIMLQAPQIISKCSSDTIAEVTKRVTKHLPTLSEQLEQTKLPRFSMSRIMAPDTGFGGEIRNTEDEEPCLEENRTKITEEISYQCLKQ